MTQGGHLNVPIYGVPAGGGWQEFKSSLATKSQETNEQLTTEQARSIAWTGLSQTSAHAYADCLHNLSDQNPGMHLFPKNATEEDVTLYILWNPGDFGPSSVGLNWESNGVVPTNLPLTINKTQGGIPFRFPRPSHGIQKLVVRYKINGIEMGGADIAIAAFTKPPTPIPNCVQRNAAGDRCVRCMFTVQISHGAGEYCDAGDATHPPAQCPAGHVVHSTSLRPFICPSMPTGEDIRVRFKVTAAKVDGHPDTSGGAISLGAAIVPLDPIILDQKIPSLNAGNAEVTGGIFLCQFGGNRRDARCTLEGQVWIFTLSAPPE
jgi:hypothetical protein